MNTITRLKYLFVLIGNNNTGKTTFQRMLVDKICNQHCARLDVNKRFNIEHPEFKRKYQTISFANRSYQEKKDVYISVDNYFKEHFKPADIAIISSHLIVKDIEEMVRHGKENFFNVVGVFFRNSIQNNETENVKIYYELAWDERLIIENKFVEEKEKQNQQLEDCAENFVAFIVNKTSV